MRLFVKISILLVAVFVSLPASEQISGQETPQSAPTVKATSFPIAAERFLNELTNQLSTQLKLDGELQLELTRPWTSPLVAAGAVWQLEIIELPAQASSNMLVRCRLVADGASIGQWSLIVHAMLWRDTWVTRQPVDRGQTFDVALVDSRRIDTLRERDTVPTTATDGSMAFTRQLTSGRLVSWHDLAKKSLVRKGDIVEVAAIDGSLSITMKAQALANGARGDPIAVRNLESKKDFPALVVAESRVQVRF